MQKVLGQTAIVLLLAGAAAATAADPPSTSPKNIAVLEVKTDPNASPELHSQARYLTQVLRGELNRELPHLAMMTRENMVLLLANVGSSLEDCDSECEVDTGRRLGVDLVVTSELITFGKELRIVVQLFDTRSAILLRSERVSGSEATDIEKQLPVIAHQIASSVPGRLVGSSQVESEIKGSGVPTMQAPPVGILVDFNSDPPGAIVEVDGEMLCSRTPCTREVAPGPRTITMQLEDFEVGTRSEVIASSHSVSLVLAPRFGLLDIDTFPGNLHIQVNGARTQTPAHLRLFPGPYTVTVDDPCFRADGQTIVIKKGELRHEILRPNDRIAGVRARAKDGSGNDIAAELYADGQPLGQTPKVVSLSICTKTLSAKSQSGRATESLQLREGTVQDVVLRPVQEAALPSAQQSYNAPSNGRSSCDSTQTIVRYATGFGALAAGVAGIAGTSAAFVEKHNADSLPPGSPGISGDISTGKALNVAGVTAFVVAAFGLTAFFVSLPEHCGGGSW